MLLSPKSDTSLCDHKKFFRLSLKVQGLPVYQLDASPNKLFDYLASGKPIILARYVADDPVAKNNCRLSVKSGQPIEVADSILQLKNLPKEARDQMGLNGLEYLKTHHSYEKISLDYTKLT